VGLAGDQGTTGHDVPADPTLDLTVVPERIGLFSAIFVISSERSWVSAGVELPWPVVLGCPLERPLLQTSLTFPGGWDKKPGFPDFLISSSAEESGGGAAGALVEKGVGAPPTRPESGHG
jgi:hypothetical protein